MKVLCKPLRDYSRKYKMTPYFFRLLEQHLKEENYLCAMLMWERQIGRAEGMTKSYPFDGLDAPKNLSVYDCIDIELRLQDMLRSLFFDHWGIIR